MFKPMLQSLVHLSSTIFPIVLCIQLGQSQASLVVFACIPLIFLVFTYCDVHSIMNTLGHMTPFVMSLHPLQRKLSFMWIKNNYTLFHLPSFKHPYIALTLSFLKMGFEPMQTLSLLITCKYSSPCTFYMWFLQDQKQPKQGNKVINIATREIFSSSYQQKALVVYKTKLMIFYNFMPIMCGE